MCTTDGDSPLDVFQAALDGLVGVDPVELADETVRVELPRLLAAVNGLVAWVSTVVGTFDARGLSDVDGLRTSRTWLTAFGRMSQGAATGWLKRARLLRELPGLAAAAGRGEMSAEHLREVCDLVDRVGVGAVRDFDEILAKVGAATAPAEMGKACERILAHVDPDGPEPDPRASFDRRALTVSRSGSMFSVRGQLDPEGGAALLTALDALMRPPTADDLRTAPQRRADAMVELARLGLGHGRVPTVGGIRPHLGVLITPRALLA